MRLCVKSPEGLLAVTAVEPERSTVLCFDATPHVGAGVVDVLCLRPDGLTWHLGSVAGRPGSVHYEIELAPFHLEGNHVLSIEVGGRPLASTLTIEVKPSGREQGSPRRRRYLGRGGV